eukprot:6188096-Pleurochrysis_carterae.AAC.2
MKKSSCHSGAKVTQGDGLQHAKTFTTVSAVHTFAAILIGQDQYGGNGWGHARCQSEETQTVAID